MCGGSINTTGQLASSAYYCSWHAALLAFCRFILLSVCKVIIGSILRMEKVRFRAIKKLARYFIWSKWRWDLNSVSVSQAHAISHAACTAASCAEGPGREGGRGKGEDGGHMA